MNAKNLISDIDEAVTVIETYRLAALVWTFQECPLKELVHYVPNGREEVVIVYRSTDSYLTHRMIFQPYGVEINDDAARVVLKYHEDYLICIILNFEDSVDPSF